MFADRGHNASINGDTEEYKTISDLLYSLLFAQSLHAVASRIAGATGTVSSRDSSTHSVVSACEEFKITHSKTILNHQ